MPRKEIVRERVIRLIQEHAPIARRTLEQSFAASTRELAKEIISELLSEQYIAQVGTGRRGSPETIVRSAGWPAAKCPMCGKDYDEQLRIA